MQNINENNELKDKLIRYIQSLETDLQETKSKEKEIIEYQNQLARELGFLIANIEKVKQNEESE